MGCTLDWTVRPDSIDASTADTGTPSETGAEDVPTTDAESDRGVPVADADATANPVDASECPALKADKDTLTSLISRLHEARVGLRNAIQSSDSTEDSVRAASAI